MMHSKTIVDTTPAAASGVDEACTQNYIQEHTLQCAPDEVLCS